MLGVGVIIDISNLEEKTVAAEFRHFVAKISIKLHFFFYIQYLQITISQEVL